jgi:hypothetical protein
MDGLNSVVCRYTQSMTEVPYRMKGASSALLCGPVSALYRVRAVPPVVFWGRGMGVSHAIIIAGVKLVVPFIRRIDGG